MIFKVQKEGGKKASMIILRPAKASIHYSEN